MRSLPAAGLHLRRAGFSRGMVLRAPPWQVFEHDERQFSGRTSICVAGMMETEPQAAVARSYDAQAAGYDRRWARYVARSTDLTLDAMPRLVPGARLLDVGCGTGQLLAALSDRDAGLTLTGVDVSAAMLAHAAERLGAEVALCRAPAERLPFDDAAFDVVVSASSLHHWPDPACGLTEMARVLARDGVLVLTDWCRESWSMRLMDAYLRLRDLAHNRALTRGELAALVTGAGLAIDSQTRHWIDWPWQLQVVTARPAPADAGRPLCRQRASSCGSS